jgi:hypothetical protein
MRPFQAFRGVQHGQRHHVLLVATFGQADDHADGLSDLQHGLLFGLEGDAAEFAVIRPYLEILKVRMEERLMREQLRALG